MVERVAFNHAVVGSTSNIECPTEGVFESYPFTNSLFTMNFDETKIDDDAPMVSNGEWISDDSIELETHKSSLYGNFLSVQGVGPAEFKEPKPEYINARFQANIAHGKAAELTFSRLCAQLPDASLKESSLGEDMRDRIDFFLQWHGVQIPLDVKALRSVKMNRGLQNRYMWLELHATGTLWSGKSTCIALQYAPEKFVLLSKAALRAFVKQRFTNPVPVRWNQQALYRAYRREGKREWIGLIELQDCLSTCGVALIS
jgi:hypothetical protein